MLTKCFDFIDKLFIFFPLLQILLSFLTPGANRIQNQICEVLDTDLIRQQAEHNAVDIHGLANYIINTMGKLCAPIRDNDIKQLKATDNIVELLRLVFSCFYTGRGGEISNLIEHTGQWKKGGGKVLVFSDGNLHNTSFQSKALQQKHYSWGSGAMACCDWNIMFILMKSVEYLD